jgi:predicted RNA-binding Zn ribbon-like protein
MGENGFQLVGGHPALDFLNTIHDWTVSDPRDHLPAFADAVRFGEAAGILSRREATRLGSGPAGNELTRLGELRTRLERVFRALITGKPPPPADLEALGRDAAAAAATARLRRAGRRLERTLDVDAAGPAALRWRLVEAAVGLLTSPALERVKACPGCGWFFLDTTKNRSRRWCSMAVCGNSAKARAYYWRNRSG